MTIDDLIDSLELIKCAKGNVKLKDLAYIKTDDVDFSFEHCIIFDTFKGKRDKYTIEFSPNMALGRHNINYEG